MQLLVAGAFIGVVERSGGRLPADMSELILIVDDEKDLVQTLDYNLRRGGYRTRSAYTGEDALRSAEQAPRPDLVLLDLMLPDIPGTEVCRQIRANEGTRAIPVLMLTAKGEEIARIVGFEAGADDYVVKPFSVRELMLRIQAILRRVHHEDRVNGVSRFGILEVDPDAHRVLVNGRSVTLSALEFRLLNTFLESQGRVQTREMLLDKVWDIHAEIQTRTVDVHVKRLRTKLGAAGDYIRTLRGVGYRFLSRPDEEAS